MAGYSCSFLVSDHRRRPRPATDSQFRMFILERLEQMERRMAEMVAGSDQRQRASQRPPPDMEEKAPAPQVTLPQTPLV